MEQIDGISYFRKPWDYGAGGGNGNGGKLIVEDDKLVVVARRRKKIRGLGTMVEGAGGMIGGMAVAAAEAASEAERTPREFRIEIPKDSIKTIYALPLGLGVSYHVETTESTDQLDVNPAEEAQFLAALRQHGYPLAETGWEKKAAAAAAAIGLILVWILLRTLSARCADG